MVEAQAGSVIQKLRTETRTCPQCDLEVRHPLVERCPRCYSILPKFQLECSGCIHQVVCPVAKEPVPVTR
jgi:hypothetical protein